MEQLLQYLWKYRLYRATDLQTTQGESLEIIDTGIQNRDAGPDFFNAKIKINGTVWAGSVEIHEKASDWFLHGHDSDKAYDNVILHVVQTEDTLVYRSNHDLIPQWEIIVPSTILRNMEWLLSHDGDIPCFERLPEIDTLYQTEWLDRLLCERLERKTADIYKWLDLYKQDWNEAFYILLCRNFGFGVNSDIFERLARSLPLKYIQKQRGSVSQIEALFLGQAGMLEEPCQEFHHYYRFLQQEYQFLRKKFGLEPLEPHLFRRLRVRPNASPYIKLAQLAAIWVKHDTLFSALLNAGNLREIKSYLRAETSEFWDTHYNFRESSPMHKKVLGDKALDIILINTVAPMMFAYGKYHHLPEYTERALMVLERIPPEENRIIHMFRTAGILARNAGDTQALIQLKRNYCEQKKCLFCHFGFQLLKSAP